MQNVPNGLRGFHRHRGLLHHNFGPISVFGNGSRHGFHVTKVRGPSLQSSGYSENEKATDHPATEGFGGSVDGHEDQLSIADCRGNVVGEEQIATTTLQNNVLQSRLRN